MRLTAHVTLVASGAAGFDLTDPLDCHVYLVRGERHSALIDAGAGRSTEAILDHGVPDCVLLTHGHADHAGGAAALARRGVPIYAGTPACEWIAAGDDTALSVDRGRAAGVYPPDYAFPACPGVRPVRHGEELDLGGAVLRAVVTPGHADGHVCYLLKTTGYQALFSGDCVFTGGRISLQNLHDCRIQDYAASLETLAGLDVDALFSGHHEISLSRAHRHLTAARDVLARGLLPRSTT